MSQLYLYSQLRDYYKKEIESFTQLYLEKLFPVFDNIEEESEEYSNEYFEEQMKKNWNPSLDPSEFAAQAIDMGIMKYSELSIAKYDFTASSISTLYHIWEQQVRKFLFNELSHDQNLTMSKFCTNWGEIKKVFKDHTVNIEKLSCWPRINELQLLNNAIKHGDGRSYQKLLQLKPDLIKEKYRSSSYNFEVESTLLTDVLNINKSTFKYYSQAVIDFWDELPERSYSK